MPAAYTCGQRTNILRRTAGSGAELPEYPQCLERRGNYRSRRHPSRLWISVGERPFCRSLRVDRRSNSSAPPPKTSRLMGDKAKAREIVAKRGLPVTPGSPGELRSEAGCPAGRQNIGFPVIIKASAGGGGRGMRVVNKAEELARAFQAAQAEAKSTFGHDGVYLERYFLEPRHIEVQIVADQPRSCGPPRRTRLFHSTPASETGRRNPLARRR